MFPKNMYLKNLIDIYDSLDRKLDMDTLGLLGLKLQIPSPSYRTNSQEVDGRSGITIMDRFLNSRNLTAEFVTMGDDYRNSLEVRNNLYRLLGNGKMFWMAENEIPNKRWRVYLDEWTPERRDVKVHTFEIPLTCEMGCSESSNFIKKTFTTSTFKFNNEGDLTIDPRIHSETEIKFTGVSNNLQIKNNTTGDIWTCNTSTTSSETFTLLGVRSLLEGISIFGLTNKKLITMAPGWNNFELIGATNPFTLTIKTRFYFL